MNWNNLPNLITLARFLLVAPIVYFQYQGMYFAALCVFFVAGVSDALDGFLAKRFHWSSRLGAVMDPLADKLLLIAMGTLLALQGHIPVWLVLLIVGRDLLIVGGAIGFHNFFGHVPMEPSLSSKINTFFQLSLVVVILFSLALWPVLSAVSQVLQWIVAATTIYSGAEYVVVWGQRASVEWKARND